MSESLSLSETARLRMVTSMDDFWHVHATRKCEAQTRSGSGCNGTSLVHIERGVCNVHATPAERVLNRTRRDEWARDRMSFFLAFSEAIEAATS